MKKKKRRRRRKSWVRQKVAPSSRKSRETEAAFWLDIGLKTRVLNIDHFPQIQFDDEAIHGWHKFRWLNWPLLHPAARSAIRNNKQWPAYELSSALKLSVQPAGYVSVPRCRVWVNFCAFPYSSSKTLCVSGDEMTERSKFRKKGHKRCVKLKATCMLSDFLPQRSFRFAVAEVLCVTK